MNRNSDSVSPLPHAVTMTLSCTSIKQPKYERNPYIYIYLYLLPKSRMRGEKKRHFLCGQHLSLLYASAVCSLILSRMRTSVPAISQALVHLETHPPKTVEDVECILKVHLIIDPGAAQFFLCFRRTEGTLSASFHTLEFTSILQ